MRQINRVAVLGAGVMRATIAAHLANAGLEILLLDIVPKALDKQEEAQGPAPGPAAPPPPTPQPTPPPAEDLSGLY